MRITFTTPPCGMPATDLIRRAVTDARGLARRRHQVTLVCPAGRPGWLGDVPEITVTRELPAAADAVVAVHAAALAPALECAGRTGAAVFQLSHGLAAEDELHDPAALRSDRGHAAGQPSDGPTVHVLAANQAVADEWTARTGRTAVVVGVGIDPASHHPAPAATPPAAGRRIRIGVPGSYAAPACDLPNAVEACRLASQAGLDLELVRITPDRAHADEQGLVLPVEWREAPRADERGALMRSLDAVLLTAPDDRLKVDYSALEAIACGVPLVATEVPAHDTTALGCRRDRPCGLYVGPARPLEAAEALVLLTRHEPIGRELRSNAREQAAALDHGPVLDRIERALESAVAAEREARADAGRGPARAAPGVAAAGPAGAAASTMAPRTPPADPTHASAASGGDPAPASRPARPEARPAAPGRHAPPLVRSALRPQNAVTTTPPGAVPTAPTPPGSCADRPAEEPAAVLDEARARILDTLRETSDLERYHDRYLQAAAYLRAALVLAPDDADLLQRHGYAAYLAGEDREALASYDRLEELGLRSSDLSHNRGLVLATMEDLSGAVAALEDAARQPGGADNALLHNDLGVTRFRIGDPAGARAAFENALAIDPDLAEARANLEALTDPR